jgi:hypothetical protein
MSRVEPGTYPSSRSVVGGGRTPAVRPARHLPSARRRRRAAHRQLETPDSGRRCHARPRPVRVCRAGGREGLPSLKAGPRNLTGHPPPCPDAPVFRTPEHRHGLDHPAFLTKPSGPRQRSASTRRVAGCPASVLGDPVGEGVSYRGRAGVVRVLAPGLRTRAPRRGSRRDAFVIRVSGHSCGRFGIRC